MKNVIRTKTTRADVAKAAGVSEATISYVLNKSRPVSQKTIDKVMAVIKELDYHPDMIARTMVTNELRQLAIVVNDIVNPLYGEVILGFESAAIAKGYFVNICTGYKNLDEYISNFISRRNDGVYMAAIPSKFDMDSISRLTQYGVSLVASGSMSLKDDTISHIDPNFSIGILEAVRHLKELGHTNIAMINAFDENYLYDNRLQAYNNAINTYLPEGKHIVIEGEPPYSTDIQAGKRLTAKLLERSNDFTAVICTNDLMALGCISQLKSNGYDVPGDVSVVGIDDILFARELTPTLSTVGYDKTSYGMKAFEMLYDNMKSGNVSNVSFKTEFIPRESVSPPKSRI